MVACVCDLVRFRSHVQLKQNLNDVMKSKVGSFDKQVIEDVGHVRTGDRAHVSSLVPTVKPLSHSC